MTDWTNIAGWICFSFLSLIFLFTEFTFVKEREWRAVAKGFFVFTHLLVIVRFVFFGNFSYQASVIIVVLLCGLIFILFLIYPQKSKRLQIKGEQKKVDERDAIFHRFIRLKPGDPEFEEFYSLFPEKKKTDEAIRRLPSLGEPGSRSYHFLSSLFQTATFDVVSKITRDVEWEPELTDGKSVQAPAEEFTKRIKGFSGYLGADLVGITKLNPAYVYSHIGRSPGTWGASIKLKHKNAIVIATEMNYDLIKFAPDVTTTTESAFQYFETAKVAMILAKYINLLGYEARAHVDGNYRVMCVPIAANAGLGELGRLGLLITPEFGPRVRLSVVTTDLPLTYDQPISFGVQHFCSICKKCASNCPSAAIEYGQMTIHNGAEKWQSNQENCYRFWRIQGSDCNVCVKVCPYSNPKTPLHELTRWLVKRNNFSRKLMYWGDRFFYGERRKTQYKLPEWHNRDNGILESHSK
jgi:reductive dehalogenase